MELPNFFVLFCLHYGVNYPLAELKCSYNDIQKVAHVVDFQ